MNRHLALSLSLLAAIALPVSASAKQQNSTAAACGSTKVVAIDGVLASGSVLDQVAGFDTDIVRDDRYSGTLVVNVSKPAAKGKAKAKKKAKATKKRSFTLDNVRIQGIALIDDETAPASGTPVRLVGRRTKACAAAGSTPTASAASAGKGKVTVIDNVRFKAAKGTAGSSDEDSVDSGDDTSDEDAPLPGEDTSEEGSADSSSEGEDPDDATYAEHKQR